MKTTVNFFRTLLLAVLTLTFGACGEDSLLAELGLDGQTSTKVDGAGEVWDGSVAESFAGGSGTAEDPYLIADGAQLARFASMVNGGQTSINGKLTADILLNDISNWTSWNESTAPANSWTPIGSITYRFSGTLDGDGHSVSGIYINSTEISQGLVGVLGEGGTLQNLGVKASYIKGNNFVGGVCGYNDSGPVTNCYNTGSVEGNSQVGGVCGRNDGTVSNCYNTGSVTGTGDHVGGVCGLNYDVTVTNCYNTGSVEGTGDYVGGVCGDNYLGTVTNCYNIGSVEGNEIVGGVCGRNSSTVTNCYNSGSVEGNSQVGGVCGLNGRTLTNCYNTGSVAGNRYVGGVCGLNYTTVTNCYYLAGTANSGIGSGSGEATAKTAEQFQSGAVAYLLQGEQAGQVWGQNLTLDPKDTYPVLGGLKVVQNGDGYANELKQDGDFYLISTADELRLFASMINNGNPGINGRLTADIELNNTTGWENWSESNAPANSWTPIGNSWENQFTGTLDGDGHSVSGIYINSTADYQGLVGYLGGGTLQNLGVKASYIKGGNRVGGLCGRNYHGTVTNCYNAGNVAGNSSVGGVCGYNNSGTVTNCYNTGSVSGNRFVGGLCGWNDGTVTNCYNTANVTGTGDYVGGLCGGNAFGGTVTNCYNTGSVEGNYSVGGLCGQNSGTVTNCYYLAGKANSGIGSGSGEATAKTAEQFKSGEVASLLGDAWGQNIGSDGSPVLDSNGSTKVYAITIYNGTSIAETSYHNSSYSISLTGNAIALVDAGSPFSGKNIVVKDGDSYTCAELVLADGEDFYTPVAFTATKATYTRSPKVWATNDGSGSGWETLCLPFSGMLYAGEEAKEPVLTDLAGDYWLRSLTDFKTPNTLIFASGSTATAADHQIEAGMPYIIALPGETFGGESLQGQTISVRGTDVAVTNEAQSVAAGSMFAFTGTFATKACNNGAYRLNSENGSDGAGNLFVLDTELTDLAPFRCRIDVTGLIVGGASTRSASGLPKELRIGQ